jgi:hypothetical protein
LHLKTAINLKQDDERYQILDGNPCLFGMN